MGRFTRSYVIEHLGFFPEDPRSLIPPPILQPGRGLPGGRCARRAGRTGRGVGWCRCGAVSRAWPLPWRGRTHVARGTAGDRAPREPVLGTSGVPDPAVSPLLGPHLHRPLAAAEDLGRELFWSRRGGGAHRDHAPIRVSGATDPQRAVVGSTYTFKMRIEAYVALVEGAGCCCLRTQPSASATQAGSRHARGEIVGRQLQSPCGAPPVGHRSP
jgi:hypothetical protein